jgi:hypothetical protein
MIRLIALAETLIAIYAVDPAIIPAELGKMGRLAIA